MSVKGSIKRCIRRHKYNVLKWLSKHIGTKDPYRTQNNTLLWLFELNDYDYQKRRFPAWHAYRQKHHPGEFYDDETEISIMLLTKMT